MAKAKNGRKGPRSAKQKAATRKLVAMNKRRARPKRRSAPKRKANKRKAPKRTMVRRRPPPRKSKSITSKIPLINNPTFKKAAVGVGTATLGVAALNLILPQVAQHPLAKPVLALAGGGIPGVVAQFLAQGGGGLSNILGGGNGGGNGFTPGFG